RASLAIDDLYRGGAQILKNRLKALCHRHRRLPKMLGNFGKNGKVWEDLRAVPGAGGERGRRKVAERPGEGKGVAAAHDLLEPQPPSALRTFEFGIGVPVDGDQT